MLGSLLSSRVSGDPDYLNNLGNDEQAEMEEMIQAYLHDMHYTSVRQTAFNLVYSMINVGMVGLPYVAYQAGFPLYSFAIFVIAIVSAHTACIVVEMADDYKVRSLEDLAEKAFGPRGYLLTCIIQIIFSILLIVVTLDVWGDIIPDLTSKIIGDSPLPPFIHYALTSRRSTIVIGALLVLPLCFIRTMSRLTIPSYLTLCAITMAVVYVIISLFRDAECSFCYAQDMVAPRPLWWTIQPLATFVFTYQQKLFVVYNCLRQRSVPRFREAVNRSHTLVALMYLLFGLLGAINGLQSDANDDQRIVNYDFFSATGTVGPRLIFQITKGIVAFSLLFTIPVDCLVTVTTWRRLRRRYTRYRHTQQYGRNSVRYSPVNGDGDEQQALMPPSPPERSRGGSKDSDDPVDEDTRDPIQHSSHDQQQRRGPKRRSRHGNQRNREDDVICVEMMRWGGCLHEEESKGTHRRSNEEKYDHQPAKPFSAPPVSESALEHPSMTGTSSTATSLGFSASSCLSTILPPRFSFPTQNNLDPYGQAEPPLTRVHSSPSPSSSIGPHDSLVSTKKPQSSPKVGFADEPVVLPRPPYTDCADDVDMADEHTNPYNNRVSLAHSDMSGFSSTAPTVIWDHRVTQASLREEQTETDDSVPRESTPEFSEETWRERRSSVGHMMERERSIPDYINHIVLVLSMWSTALFLSCIEEEWILWVAITASIITSIFAFILPSMMYFRLGLRSDFRSIPLMGSILPNRLFMYLLQAFGLICILGNLVGYLWLFLKYTDWL